MSWLSDGAKKGKKAWDDNTQAPSSSVGNPFAGTHGVSMRSIFGGHKMTPLAANQAYGSNLTDNYTAARNGYARSSFGQGTDAYFGLWKGTPGYDFIAKLTGYQDKQDLEKADKKRHAEQKEAKLQGDLARQQALASGAGGGGAQAGAEASAYGNVMSNFAQQQEAIRQQKQQQDMQNLMLLFRLFAGGV